MSQKTSGRIVGALFLLAFVAYLSGSALVDQAREAGALLMLTNSAVVLGIGVLVLPTLSAHHPASAHGYLAGRTVEAVMLAVGVILLLARMPGATDGNEYSYQIAMIAAGAAGMLFCRVLWRAGLTPAFLAGWGLIGYAALLAGAVLEILGYPVGVALAVPGGLFEVALGVFLLTRGLGPAERSLGPAGRRLASQAD